MSKRYADDSRYTIEEYFDLVARGVLAEDDRVELLDGIIVAEPPMDPPHAVAIETIAAVLRAATAGRAAVRTQAPFLISPYSVPEPDIAVVPGRHADYWDHHPTEAFLVVEVSGSSLQQDRLSKSRIYASAAIAEYWIVNLRDDCLETFRSPDPSRRLYSDRQITGRGSHVELVAIPDVRIAVDDILPLREG